MTKDEEIEILKERSKFFQDQFRRQLDYSHFVSKQLSDLHSLIMSKAYYQAGGSMSLHFYPKEVDGVIYRSYPEKEVCDA